MKMAVFWVVAPCTLEKFTHVSEVPAASIIRAIALKTEGSYLHRSNNRLN
jgi:hypothetical protein